MATCRVGTNFSGSSIAAAKKCMTPDIFVERKDNGEPQLSQNVLSTPGEELNIFGGLPNHRQLPSKTPI